MACKPGSVLVCTSNDHSSRLAVANKLKQPTTMEVRKRNLPNGQPSNWFCFRWGLPCRRCYQKRGALLPHPFILTHACTGGLLSVALSLRSPSPAINRHRVSVKPGLSSPQHIPSGDHPAICCVQIAIFTQLSQACCTFVIFKAQSAAKRDLSVSKSIIHEKIISTYRPFQPFSLQLI